MPTGDLDTFAAERLHPKVTNWCRRPTRVGRRLNNQALPLSLSKRLALRVIIRRTMFPFSALAFLLLAGHFAVIAVAPAPIDLTAIPALHGNLGLGTSHGAIKFAHRCGRAGVFGVALRLGPHRLLGGRCSRCELDWTSRDNECGAAQIWCPGHLHGLFACHQTCPRFRGERP